MRSGATAGAGGSEAPLGAIAGSGLLVVLAAVVLHPSIHGSQERHRAEDAARSPASRQPACATTSATAPGPAQTRRRRYNAAPVRLPSPAGRSAPGRARRDRTAEAGSAGPGTGNCSRLAPGRNTVPRRSRPDRGRVRSTGDRAWPPGRRHRCAGRRVPTRPGPAPAPCRPDSPSECARCHCPAQRPARSRRAGAYRRHPARRSTA